MAIIILISVVQCEMISDCYAQDIENEVQDTRRALAFNAEGCYISSLSLNHMGLLQHRHRHLGVFEEDVVALLQRFKHGNESHYKFRGWVLYTRHVYWYAKDYTKIVVQPLIFPGIPNAPGAVPTYCLGPHWYTRHQAKLVLVYQHYLRHFQAIASMPGSIHECIHACLVA